MASERSDRNTKEERNLPHILAKAAKEFGPVNIEVGQIYPTPQLLQITAGDLSALVGGCFGSFKKQEGKKGNPCQVSPNPLGVLL